MPRPCKACESPHRERIDALLLAGAPARAVIEEMASKGETYHPNNLTRHRAHVQAEDPQLDLTLRELRHEMDAAHSTVAPMYAVLIKSLEQATSAHPKVGSAELVLKASEAIARVGGLGYKQRLMLAYVQRAWENKSGPFNQEIAARQRAEMDAQHPTPPDVGSPFDDEEL